jgi:hypothetical protein
VACSPLLSLPRPGQRLLRPAGATRHRPHRGPGQRRDDGTAGRTAHRPTADRTRRHTGTTVWRVALELLADPRVRLGAGAAGVLITAHAARAGTVGRGVAPAFRAVNGLPDSLYPPLWLIMQFSALGAVPAVAGGAWLAGDRRLAARGVPSAGEPPNCKDGLTASRCWARGSGSRTLGSGQGLQGRYGSGGLAVPGSAPLGFGDAAEADFEAEGAPSRRGHDQRAVKARVTLPRTRAGEPRASMRACSYHASPGPGQGNVLWIGLWMIYVNTLVNLSTAVDEGCCGKVDNRCDTGSCQVAGLPRSTGRYEVSTGEPAGRLIPCCARARSNHGGIRGHGKVPMPAEVS